MHRISAITALLLLAWSALSGCRESQTTLRPAEVDAPRPNILLLTVDTLRADHLAAYGYDRDTMPEIGRFLDEAVVFDNAVVPRGITAPSYASMLTGLYPFRHGVRRNEIVVHADLTLLAEVMRSLGYHTAGFVSNSVLIGEVFGLDQGFDVYDDDLNERETGRFNYERTAGNTVEAIVDWLADDPPEPFFLFVNLIDPHGPYHPPEPFNETFRSDDTRFIGREHIRPYMYVEGQLNYYDYVDRYDGEIRFADHALGKLRKELEARDLWDDALVIFTADHGESMGEHGYYFRHHFGVWEETVRVPLALRLPRSAGDRPDTRLPRDAFAPRRIADVCSPMDLMPTLLDYLRADGDADFDGQSLLPLFEGESDPDRMILLEFPSMASLPPPELPDVYAIRSQTHKLMRSLDPKSGEVLKEVVFDLRSDPLELRSIAFDADDPLHRRLDEAFQAWMKELADYQLPFRLTVYGQDVPRLREIFLEKDHHHGIVVKELSDEQAERLRSLGYLR